MTKNLRVEFRCSEEEKKKFLKNAKQHKLNGSEYILSKCVYLKSEKEISISRNINKLISELSAIGNNLNQISKNMNTFKGIYSEKDMKHLEGLDIAFEVAAKACSKALK